MSGFVRCTGSNINFPCMQNNKQILSLHIVPTSKVSLLTSPCEGVYNCQTQLSDSSPVGQIWPPASFHSPCTRKKKKKEMAHSKILCSVFTLGQYYIEFKPCISNHLPTLCVLLIPPSQIYIRRTNA